MTSEDAQVGDPACPDFLVIGAQRAATTWLHEILRMQSKCWVPPLKELHFFDLLYERRAFVEDRPNPKKIPYWLRRYGALRRRAFLRTLLQSENRGLDLWFVWRYYFLPLGRLQRYRNLFRPAAERGRLSGEVTPAYAILPVEVIEDVYRLNPGMKMIYILRDPIERAWSHAVKDLCRNVGRCVEEIPMDQFIEFVRAPECVQRSDYLSCLERWESVFPKQQFFIESFDRIGSDPEGFLEDTFAFLGVDPARASRMKGLQEKRNVAAGKAKGMPEPVRDVLLELHLANLEKLADRFPFVRAWVEKWTGSRDASSS